MKTVRPPIQAPIRLPIRAIGNSRGILIPKPLLVQAGLEATADLTVEGGALVLRKPAAPVRAGWAAAANSLSERGEDVLVMGAFSNVDDADLTW